MIEILIALENWLHSENSLQKNKKDGILSLKVVTLFVIFINFLFVCSPHSIKTIHPKLVFIQDTMALV